MGRFYVYILFRPNGLPLYVGKGQGSRWTHHERVGLNHANKHLARVIANAGGSVPKVKLREGLSEAEAIETEIALIAAIGREANGGPLVNLTDGGDGQSGWNPSPETRERISRANTAKTHTEETKAKMSAAHKGKPKSAEWRANISAASLGKVMSEASRQKMREAAIRRWASIRAAA